MSNKRFQEFCMKKFAVILWMLIGLLTFTLTGCTNGDTFTEKSYLSSDEIKKVTVQVEDRALEIGASEDNHVYIDYFDSKKEYLDITVSEGNELTIKLLYNKTWTDYIGRKSAANYRKITIRLPNGSLTAFSASTTNADITMSPLSFTEHIALNANGGNILCERVSAGKSIRLTAKNGNITGSVIGGWDDFSIACTIKKGECNLPKLKEGGYKSFTADCNNGNIDIAFVK